MFIIGNVKIRSYETGLYFRDNEFAGLLGKARHWFFDPLGRVRVDVVSHRAPWLYHSDLDLIVKSGGLADKALVLDLKDHERALVWIDGRFDRVLPAGLFAIWNTVRDVRTEIVDARTVRFEHKDLVTVLKSSTAAAALDACTIENGHAGVYFRDGEYVETLPAGQHAFWTGTAKVRVHQIDVRETMLDVSGQEIMTADKVTLRMNTVLTYRVADAQKAVCQVDDAKQALYREAQLALRAAIGTRELDAILTEKDAVADELRDLVRKRAATFGVTVTGLGIRDVILPGDMKELLNKVTEARKAAEASLITRREETAAMRSQANTAKLLDSNPTLMRLRELEVLEHVAQNAKLNVMLGEKGLADKVINLV